jgi:hypothetical protein
MNTFRGAMHVIQAGENGTAAVHGSRLGNDVDVADLVFLV